MTNSEAVSVVQKLLWHKFWPKWSKEQPPLWEPVAQEFIDNLNKAGFQIVKKET